MLQEIDKNLAVIDDCLLWAGKYRKDSFPVAAFKEARRKLKRIKAALAENCSAAAYGESQVGKSYLISSLLSTPDTPFAIRNKGKEYSFIDDLNTSGGKNVKVETTGVITRFTIKDGNPGMADYVRAKMLGMVDIILMMVDSYYNDIQIDAENALDTDALNQAFGKLAAVWKGQPENQKVVSEDDICDIYEYIHEVVGQIASPVLRSDFRQTVGSFISRMPSEHWVDVFGLLWNRNEKFNELFNTLVTAYRELGFVAEIYLPFDAMLQSKGSLLDVNWLDGVFGQKGLEDAKNPIEKEISVFSSRGELLAERFEKSKLSALISELTFVLSASIAEDRGFLNRIDLLDFPGARSREKFKEQEIADAMPLILRRGKVAYLFNKYSRSLQISTVLFCHHNDQKTGPTIGETIHEWICQNIGETPEERTRMIERTKGIAPLFFVATKFNIELEKLKNDKPECKAQLSEHWKRFETVIPEIVQPYRWMDDWVEPSGQNQSRYFRNMYLLRDFYWSGKNRVFDGYKEGIAGSCEKKRHEYEDYPDFWEDLEQSFEQCPFVQKHFAVPRQAWNDVAEVNCDGSKPIIRNLTVISDVLDEARRTMFLESLRGIRAELLKKLQAYYEPEDKAAQNQRVVKIANDIHCSLELSISRKPEIFGQIIDRLMVHSAPIRDIAYGIIMLQSFKPVDFTQINFLWGKAHVLDSDSREMKLQKLCSELGCRDEAELDEVCRNHGMSMEDLLAGEKDSLSTRSRVLVKHIVDYWNEHIHKTMSAVSAYLPHSDTIAFVLLNLLDKLGVRMLMTRTIDRYEKRFEVSDLPNAVADYTAMVLNNFVSTVGRDYMKEKDLTAVEEDAKACHIDGRLDFSASGCSTARKEQNLEDALATFENSADLVRKGSIADLRRLPWWDNFLRWENLLTIGVLYSNEISRVDPEANAAVNELIERTEELYK